MMSLSVAIAQTQAKLIEKVEKKEDEIVIPYQKYQLPNGMTILIHVDKSDPIVHVDVTYHVGSAREELGRSGFAHFFEHMMFQGSDNVADEEHFKIVTESGGTLNGTTNMDRTNYFQTMPSNQLEVALWLEADRMGFLLDAVTQQKFEIQRATVKNERGQNYDNRPYGLVYEKTLQALYPFGHPYSWPTIGYLEDLDRVTVEDLKRFFLRWYGPNNAVLTVAGDVDVNEVLRLAEKYFGSIPRGPEVKRMAKAPAVLDKDRYISYEDNIKMPLILMAWPSVEAGHPDEPALDLLAKILGGGKTSILYKNLVKSNIAIQANAMNPSSELAGSFQARAVVYPGCKLSEIENIIRESFLEFETRGVTDDDLERFKNSYEADLLNSLNSVAGKASKLAYNFIYFRNPNHIVREQEMVRNLKKEDVIRVYNKYIKDKPAVILSTVPKGQRDLVAAPDNFKPKLSSETAGEEGKEYKNLKYVKAKDNFDRSKRPSAGPNPVVNLPEFWQRKLENGFRIIGTQDKELPGVNVLISFKAGHMVSSPEDAGIAAFVAEMMNKSTKNYSTEAFTEALEKLGSRINVGSDGESNYIYMSSLKKNLKPTLALLNERLLNPSFSQEDYDQVKKQTLASITDAATKPKTIADNVFAKLMYQEGIRSIPTSGTEASINNISLDDVKNFYIQWFNPLNGSIVIVGDITQNEWMEMTPFLASWEGKDIPLPKFADAPSIEKTRIYLVDKPGAPQSEIRMGHPALKYDATGEFYRANIMNYPLGGAFNSRINLNLREEKGFTYGARSSFDGNQHSGIFYASASVKGDKTDSSLVEFFYEINKYVQNGISNEELSFTKSSLGQRDALKYETPFQKSSFLNRILEYNLPADYTRVQASILRDITKNDIDGLAKRYIRPANMHVLVVGDKASILEPIRKLGYEIIELDTEGAPVQ
ncbi:MAG: M16 family metallopeptidase [Flavobacteriales bacterium]